MRSVWSVCFLLVTAATWPCHAGPLSSEVSNGWRWATPFPFRGLTAVASSEQADHWPAAKAIDGDTSEPEGIWQTLRDSPESAWLEVQLDRPRRVAGVGIYHQDNPRYYRSVDYAIACWSEGEWQTVVEVEDNAQAGWRQHTFPPVETDAVRITITESEYGFRMGLNEVSLLLLPEAAGAPTIHLSPVHRCDRVADMGVITWDAVVPEGASVELQTRTAPDEGGRPGRWSQWSPPYGRSGERITSPVGEWVQYRAIYRSSDAGEPTLRHVTLGSPRCVERLEVDAIVPTPGEPIEVGVRFGHGMDAASSVVGEIILPGGKPVILGGGRWSDRGRVWQFDPVTLGPDQGLATVPLAGARRLNGVLMLAEERPLIIGTEPILQRLRGIAEWIIENEQPAIFVEGYNERTLLALHEITGERRYLQHVRTWAGKLLDAQKPAGYWGTGYGDVYFADTGSALGLLINFYKFATPQERARIHTALERYLHLLLVEGDSTGKPFVHEDGSVGVGYHTDDQGNITKDLNKPYTIATALTGAEIFAAWYYMKGNERHKQIAIRACDWLLDTMVGPVPPDPLAEPGQIPYCIEDWNPGGRDRAWVWTRWPYDTSAYVGEGLIAAWTYIDDEQFRRRLVQRVRPHIQWLVRTQNADGSWAEKSSGDQLRSHGVVNLLLWYYHNVDPDPRIANAIRRYYALLVDEERGRYLQVPGNGIATCLAGRALVEIARPGVDCYRWRDQSP
ncbi:MAG: discoidin domain-containing protein [Armatimonadota bacterium]|nr:discoidin domain-containing protein [Armatimonadota bacterium]